ncbi:MAG: PDZ domain-containing protein [Thermoanaerobaculia bacterium]|nr:PDZ domain-containing protein [Thermoanaerobaculia bacterium]
MMHRLIILLRRTMSTRRRTPYVFGLLLLTAPTFATAQLLSQIEEEELDEKDTLAVAVRDPGVASDEVRELYAQAEEVFHSADQPASLPLFGTLVDLLEAQRLTNGLDDEARSLLVRSLSYRAQVHFNLGEQELVNEDLGQMLQIDPNAQLDRDLVSPKLVSEFDKVRDRTVGQVDFVLDPPDAEVWIDGIRVDGLLGPVGILAGRHDLEIRRPGYLGDRRQLDVQAGRSATIEALLERDSPILRLQTRPPGAEVFLDGQSMGITEGAASDGYVPEGAATIYRREDFSAEMILDDLETGSHILEVRKDGFRPKRMEIGLYDLLDYPMPPIVLEPESGRLTFQNMPRDATILVNGAQVRPDTPGASRPTITLPPGTHQITVVSGASRMFSTRLDLADRQSIEVRVKMRPGLTYLGVLGGDDTSSGDVRRLLRGAFGEASQWALVDHSEDGPGLLNDLGVDAEALRSLARGGPQPTDIDWNRVQRTIDQRAAGLVYLVAVLDNDLLASEAKLWIWPAAPGPSRPDSLTLPMGDRIAAEKVLRAFDRTIPLRRSELGALVVDTGALPHPVVAEVTPAGPAESAGIRIGDQILGFQGTPTQTRRQLEDRLLVAEPGESVEIAVRGAQGTRSVRVSLGTSPWIVAGREGELVDALAWARLVLLEETTDARERWIVRLDQALLQLRAGDPEGAVRQLRNVDAPQTSHGVGRATVDYWLGIALSRLGPRFRDAAVEALQRAAAVPGARLDHDDDAWVAPRAEARLHALRSGV